MHGNPTHMRGAEIERENEVHMILLAKDKVKNLGSSEEKVISRIIRADIQ